MGISREIVRIRTQYQEIATPLRARNDMVIDPFSFSFTLAVTVTPIYETKSTPYGVLFLISRGNP